MELINEKSIHALQQLILINNDRTEGYKKALEYTKDADLTTLFTKYEGESQNYAKELRALIPEIKDKPDSTETMFSGKLFRTWMDVKNIFTSSDRKSVLSSCETGEDAAKKAYETVLAERDDLNSQVISIVQKQYDQLLQSHNQIRDLRDSAS